MRKLQFVFLIILSFSAVLLATGAWLLIASIDDTSSVTVNESLQLDHADEVDKLLKLLQHSALQRDSASIFEVSDIQLESLQGFLRRAHIDLAGDAEFSHNRGVVRMSLATRIFDELKFINTTVWLKNGSGIPIDKVKIGDVSMPGWLFQFIIERSINIYTKSHSGSALFESVNNMGWQEGKAIVALNPLGPLLDELRVIDTGDKTSEQLMREKYTALFLRQLESYEHQHGIKPRSLNDYIQLVFSFAQQQPKADVVVVNESAILSLAIFTGYYRIGTLVGDVQLNANQPSAPNHSPTLANRTDLSQHFIISAALELLSKQAFTLAVGEFKELMDRNENGTGFSFVDLAADKAGVKFAVELSDPNKALRLQNKIANGIQESAYFPNIQGLQEGITKAEFTRLFLSVDSQRYKQEIENLTKRVALLPLYANE